MPVFVRSGGQWVESTPFARNGSVWTSESDSLYARDAGTWKLIHPDPAAVGELLPVEGLAVTSGPTDRAVTVGWTNPTQPTITPTDVQVRVAELGAVWTEYAYPVTSAAWASLDADTEYVVQVRLIRRVDGIVTDTSPIRHVQFTTDPAPIGAPAPDPGGSGGDTTFPWTGSTDNPTAPGTNDGCWWEIVVQILNTNAASWSDTAITDTVAGDADSWEVDLSSLDSGRIYRTCRREACDTDTDGVADTWGDWECGLPFPAPTDWDAACGGFADSANVSGLAVVADAVFRYPYLCKNAETNQMVMLEQVSGVELARGPGFYSFFTDADGEKGVKAAPGETGAPWLIVGALTAVASMLVAEADWTIASRFRATSDFTPNNGRVTTIGVFGGVVSISLTESATGWTPTAVVTTNGDGLKVLVGDEVAFDEAITHVAVVRWDDDGNLELFVDAESADTEDVSAIDVYESPSLAAYNGAPAGLAVMQQIGWDRALTNDEIATLSLPPVDDNTGITWDLQTTPDRDWQAVAWSPALRLFAAVADSGTGQRAMTSPDGVTWTQRTTPADRGWDGIAWGNGLFVAVSATLGAAEVMTSPDGTTWTQRATPTNNSWHDVCWAASLGLFVAVGSDYETTHAAMTSPDGIAWTLRSTPGNGYQGVTWSPDAGLFVAVGTDKLMTSPDGITWTARTVASEEWKHAAYSPDESIWVVVGVSGVTNRALSSPDGITWTARATPNQRAWRRVEWIDGLRFVAIANGGATGNWMAMTSPDGITWTGRIAQNRQWFGLAWAREIATLVAVAESGSTIRAMSSPGA
ncbi:MAG: hypothetical protein KDB37_14500 [Ilumatobacter sp.]|nr:hypothetical protein [Ilumatobacter sp.]